MYGRNCSGNFSFLLFCIIGVVKTMIYEDETFKRLFLKVKNKYADYLYNGINYVWCAMILGLNIMEKFNSIYSNGFGGLDSCINFDLESSR